ncbi:hypothetical protein EV681_3272 [Advenella incenata]|uniref:Uncharacterized protein n=1 Tax=Advenella incenata TaxID=267800 RepID=A0A4Q7VFJ7_9BURK|nr:hypothetical protein EV681_3272 [Advenella incenata]
MFQENVLAIATITVFFITRHGDTGSGATTVSHWRDSRYGQRKGHTNGN